MPDPEVGTRIDWIRFKLGTGPEPGTPAWEAEQRGAALADAIGDQVEAVTGEQIEDLGRGWGYQIG